MRRRLDVELVRRGLVPSRTRAVEAIDAGRVLVGGAPASTAARQVDGGEAIALLAADGPTYVSRGGHKLAAGLDAFSVGVDGRYAVDVGASTGGFTDCLLQRGAAHVYAIDVGRSQLAWSLRQDPRVSVMERTNVRLVEPGALDPRPDLCVADLSFVSLRTVAPSLLALTTDTADFVLLVKPQYEAGRQRLGRRGIVRDPEVHAAVLHEVVAGLDEAGLGVTAVVPSPLRGADGNVEFLVHARRGHATVPADALDDAVRRTQDTE
ncbi:MAG TPA: TlyA family RNA methyltransferase [Acidimicrobiia bacterium]|nr:TlyA family RNA methyltransferase [Acidimicrobiia bacterium]